MPLRKSTKKWFGGTCLAIPIMLALSSAGAIAQYYAPVVIYPYYAPPTAYQFYSRPPFQYYAPPMAYYGPYMLYYSGNPVQRFWSRQDRYRN